MLSANVHRGAGLSWRAHALTTARLCPVHPPRPSTATWQHQGAQSCSTVLSSYYARQELHMPRRACRSLVRTAASLGSAAVPAEQLPRLPAGNGPVIVWFKRDLRVADHPGLLAAAASGRGVVPVFCLDEELYADVALAAAGPKALIAAVSRLREELRGLGSDLLIRTGSASAALADVAAATGASVVVAEKEVEAACLDAQRRAAIKLRGSRTALVTWEAPLWAPANFDPNYRTWKQARGQPMTPLPAPEQLPQLPLTTDGSQLEVKHIPSVADAESALARALAAELHDDGLKSALEAMLEEASTTPEAEAAAQLLAAAVPEDEVLRTYLAAGALQGKSAPPERWGSYMAQAIAKFETPAAQGASFPALMGPAMALGALSRRQVHAEATAFERKRWGGWAPPGVAAAATARAALSAAELADFHTQLAAHVPAQRGSAPIESCSSSMAEDDVDGAEGAAEGPSLSVRAQPGGPARRCGWRWRGALTDYCVAEPANPLPGAPAILLVHGFGAFGDQWRGNLAPLAAQGYRVFAPTFPGFGRSEKAAIQYSQDAWRDFLRDFVVQVVQQPVVLAGNSIGGFIGASVAADYPPLLRGLVLINSAGPIDPSFDIDAHAMAPQRAPPPRWLVTGAAGLLLAYLERSIGKTLKWVYPSQPNNADDWLEQEIFRAACDPRASDVFASVFYLPKPRALNWLVKEAWRGPTLVLQGALDPLNDSKGRAKKMEQLCPNARAVLLDAGHCPHDEVPDLVNSALAEFIQADVMRSKTDSMQASSNAPASFAASSRS